MSENHLDLIRGMRMGPPWATCVRAIYQLIGKAETYTVKCWHNDYHGPVLDPADLRELDWTTADESALDDGSLSIIDPADAGRHVLIKPLLFQDQAGAMRLGWPMAGYVNPADGERWVRVVESPKATTSESYDSYSEARGFGPPTPSESAGPNDEFPVHPPTTTNVEGFSPMPNGPAHISGTFIVHLSDDEIDDLMDNTGENDRPILKDGRICRTKFIDIGDVIEAAAEKVSPQYANLVADFEGATVTSDNDGGFKVGFTFEIDI